MSLIIVSDNDNCSSKGRNHHFCTRGQDMIIVQVRCLPSPPFENFFVKWVGRGLRYRDGAIVHNFPNNVEEFCSVKG